MDYVMAGGFFMFLIILCSIFAITLILFKLLQLRRSRIIPARLESDLARLPEGDVDVRDLEAALLTPSPLATITKEALDDRHHTAAEAREAAETEARSQFSRLGSGISLLETIVTIAPLLGLLGTVAGLVSVFAVLGKAGGEAPEHAQLATGIARALGTTIAGLAVAIPAVIAHGHFTSLLEKTAVRVEQLVGRAITAVHRSR